MAPHHPNWDWWHRTISMTLLGVGAGLFLLGLNFIYNRYGRDFSLGFENKNLGWNPHYDHQSIPVIADVILKMRITENQPERSIKMIVIA